MKNTPAEPTTYLGLHLTVGAIVTVLGLWTFGGLVAEVLDNATLVD